MQTIRIALITVSDRAAAGKREDFSGPLAASLLSKYGAVSGPLVVPDGVESVKEMIANAIYSGAHIVFTTGGTGVTSRDQVDRFSYRPNHIFANVGEIDPEKL